MATTSVDRLQGSPDSSDRTETHRVPESKRWGTRLFVVLVLGAVAVGAIYIYPRIHELTDLSEESGVLTYEVSGGKLIVTVTEDGNVESASNVDVKCQIAGGATILWLVEDGKQVEKGEEIVRLDQSNIEDKLNSQRITYEKALATKIQVEEELEAAKISVREYEEGTFVKQLQEVEAQIIIAMENLRSAENLLEHTKRMSRKGFVTPLQLEADRFAVQRAQLELDAAKTSKTVLQEFTREKMLKQLESARDAAAAKLRAEQAAFDLEKARLERLEGQLENCVIKAPQNGMVVYANPQMGGRRGGASGPQIEEGAMVREGQNILKIPDLTQMQVKMTVHETKVDKIRRGMPASIIIQDRTTKGTVVSVANQPEQTSIFSSNVKEYATIVRINGETTGLRPGMTAQVKILVEELNGVLTVPVHVIVELGGKFYCWVDTPQGPQKRPIILGSSNDQMIEIKDGLLEGDQVLQNPRAIVAAAREELSETKLPEETDTEETFGTGGLSEEAGNAGRGQRRPGGGGPRDGSGPPQGARGGAGGPGRRPEQGRNGAARGGNPMQFDSDGDGRLSRDEAPDRMKEFFDTIDTNSDGFIDSAEFTARRQNRPGGAAGRPRGGRANESGGPRE